MGGLAAEKVITRYNDDGLAESTSGAAWYTSDVTYSPFAEPLRAVSGSQPARVWTTNFIDPHTGRLQRTVADRETADPHRVSDSSYSYDASGTITSNARSLTDASGTTRDTQCFTYDAMGELVNAWTSNITPDGNAAGCKAAGGTTWGPRTDYEASTGPVADAPDAATDTTSPDTSLASTLTAAAPDTATVATGATAYRQSFTFDWLGNRASMTEHDPADATKNVSYSYGYDSKQPHTVDSISSSPSGKGSSYTYDAAGNTEIRDLSNTTQNLTWTQENRLDTITDDGNKTTYVYDADGNRVLENSATGSTLYLGETEVTTNASGTITKAARAYAQEGAPTVIRSTVNGATTGHKINVLLADHLGTATTTAELSGTQPVTRRAYKPYGEIRGTKPSSWPNKRGYLGVGIDDAATGLTHIGAREYDQASGRFLSADPLIDIADPLQMNGYAYGNNSPISRSDPTGLMPILIPGAAMGGGGGGGEPTPTLVQQKVGKKTVIYDEYGVGHVIGGTPDNGASIRALKYLNDDLRAAGLFTDGSNKGTGEIYLPQNDNERIVEKGAFTDKDGNRRLNGTTSDFIKVTYENGKIVDVVDFDATGSVDKKELGKIDNDIRNKMDGKKAQTNNVVYVAASEAQAREVAKRWASDPRVRVIHPDSGFDTGRVFNAVTGRPNAARVSPRIRGRIFGVAGSLMPFAQANSYVRSFGFWGGMLEMGKGFFDPFGFHEAVEPQEYSGACDPRNCARGSSVRSHDQIADNSKSDLSRQPGRAFGLDLLDVNENGVIGRGLRQIEIADVHAQRHERTSRTTDTQAYFRGLGPGVEIPPNRSGTFAYCLKERLNRLGGHGPAP
ncbi:RHS repeat-associated core domain-containing protein [Streptomyces sp. NPDC051642]|uniref:RHS repeat-associated core domain-containing protein n=1 Tax=unclassified Streptomyces TaxID=2593676 RepID=UPI00342C49AF